MNRRIVPKIAVACVMLVATLSAASCIYKKQTGPGTNVGSGFDRDFPPPGQPTIRPPD